MAISRLAISNPGATTDTLLYTATRSALASIIATNKASTVAEVRIWVVPTGEDSTPENWSYIAYDADITATNSLETFRFPVMTGDKIYVRSTTADVSFQIMGIYETGADTYVYAQPNEPTAPQVGDIWVDTASDVPSIDNTTVYRWSKTAVGGETSLSGTGNDLSILKYIAGYEQVYLNGVLLAQTLDYTATNGTSITSLTALSAGDIVEVISPYAIELTDVYTKSVSDAKYDTKASSGLNLVVPTSVSVGSGTSIVSANGAVTFSGASTVSVNGCFNSMYDNYRIVIDPTASVGTDSTLSFRYRSGGSDISTSTYTGQRAVHFGTTTVASTNVTGNTVHSLSLIHSSFADLYYGVVEVHGPFLSTKKLFRADLSTVGSTSTYYLESHAGWNTTSTPCDGFSIFTNGTSISGKIRIYGYNNGGA
jgi:hypothetical protein